MSFKLYFIRRLCASLLLFVISFNAESQSLDSILIHKKIDSLINISLGYLKKKQSKEAKEIISLVEKITIENFGSESRIYPPVCFQYGYVLEFSGDLQDAELWYLKARDIRAKVKGTKNSFYAQILHNLGILNRKMSNFQKAEAFHKEAIEIRKEVLGVDHKDYGASLYSLASVYFRMNKFEEAEDYYFKALDIWKKVLNPKHAYVGSCLNGLGLLYKNMGEYEKSEAYLIEALDIKKESLGETHTNYASSLLNFGSLFLEMGNYEKAEIYYLKASNIWKNDKAEERRYAKSLNNLGNLYDKMGDYEQAEIYHLQALEIRKTALGTSHKDYASSLDNLGLIYIYTDRYEQAEIKFKEAKKIRMKDSDTLNFEYTASLNNLGMLYQKKGEFETAENFLLKSRRIRLQLVGKEHPSYKLSLQSLVSLYLEWGQYGIAETILKELIELDKILITKAIHHLTELEMDSFINQFSLDNDWMFSIAQKSKNSDSNIEAICYDNLLFYKSFLLTTYNQIKLLASSDSIASKKLNQLKSINRRISAEYSKPIEARKNIMELEANSNKIEKDLVKTIAGYEEIALQVKWQDVQKNLNQDEVAIEFAKHKVVEKDEIVREDYVALLIKPNLKQPILIPLCEAEPFEQFVREQGQMSISNLYWYEDSESNSLYNFIWEPIKSALNSDEIKTIYYSPAGQLHRLNLSAIMTPSDQVLGEHISFQVLTSTRQLCFSNSISNIENALLLGGISYDADSISIFSSNLDLDIEEKDLNKNISIDISSRSGNPVRSWGYLEGTKSETEKIDELLKEKGLETTILQGPKATEEVFKKISTHNPSPGILHFATHGYFFPDPEITYGEKLKNGKDPVFKLSNQPLIRSGLILAGANHAWETGYPFKGAEDGILTAYEISQLDLSNTELVVLSACETGLGDIKGNEGVYGLYRAFSIAGAKYILMSLWEVDDSITSVFMLDFYRFWLDDELSIESAFQKAQNKMRTHNSHIENWAGFILIKG